MKNQNKKRGLLKALSTVAASAMLVLGAGTAAYAAPTIPSADETGSINIEKRSQPTTDHGRADGLEKSGLTGSALPGAKFKVERINVDLSTNAGWIAAGEMTVAQAVAAKDSSFTAREFTTGSDGRLTFGINTETPGWATDVASRDTADLKVGLYLVTETQTPSGYVAADPFLITVPLTHPTDNDTWVYDLYVYPKNSAAPQKTVTETAVDQNGASNVVWTIESAIPNTGNAVTGYAVGDVLDSRLDYVSGAATIIGADGNPITGANQISASDYTITESAGVFKLIFNAGGLIKLTAAVAADANAKVQTTITTKVNSIGNAVIPNKAVIYDNDSEVNWLEDNTPGDCEDEENCDPGDPSDEPETKWGAVNFDKKKADGDKGALGGAEFQVFATEADALDKTNPLTAFNATGAEATTFTSDASTGKVVIEGLRYSNWFENETVNEGDTGYQAYWLVETKSPDGYELLATPIKFEVVAPDTAIALSGTTAGDLTEVVNVPHNAGFELPLTGGTGTAVITILGIALLAFVLLAGRRKRGSANHA